MDFQLIGNLVRLRYKLLWASTRTRNGKIALFFAGYLLLVMVIVIFAAGGLGAGIVAIRSGRGDVLAGGLLSGIFVQALVASVVLGFGMGVIFSDTELRRYPLRGAERRLTRHFIGIVDPFWILFFVLDLGLASGLYLFGAGGFWLGLLAVLLLFACNYVAARVVAMLVDRLVSKRFGSMALLGMVMLMGFLPSLLGPSIHKNPALLVQLKQIWFFTPPAAAGVAMTHPDWSAVRALGLIVLWTVGLLAALIAIERWPRKALAAQNQQIVWRDLADRLTGIFGPQYGPLAAHWLRFFWRNNRFRMTYPLALPLSAFLLFYFSRQMHRSGPFEISLGVFGILGFIGTGQFAVNQFGYVGGGFRRFLLLPTDPAAAFRAGSYLFVSLSGVLLLPALVLWTLFAPIPSSARLVAMLVGMNLLGLFLIHGIALWVAILGARRGNFRQTMGNDLSFAANITIIGGMLGFLFGPQLLARSITPAALLNYWWTTPLLGIAAALFYAVSLRLTAALFRKRREGLIVLLEGKG